MKLVLFFLLMSFSAAGQFGPAGKMPANNREAPAATVDSITINFSLLPQTVSGADKNWNGDPGDSVMTFTWINGWNFTTNSTANYFPYTSSPFNNAADNFNGTHAWAGIPNLASTAGTYGWFQYGTVAGYDVSKPAITVTGLNPGATYTVAMSGARGNYTGFDANPAVYTIKGLTTNQLTGINQSVTTSAASGFTTTITPTAGGQLDFYFNTTAGSSVLVCLMALKIKKN